jgi:exopolysaccharide biosynthesis polyprenyl glycosylphosphotransferase
MSSAGHAAPSHRISLRSVALPGLARGLGPAVSSRGWLRLRFAIDVIVVCLASSAALFAAPLHLDARSRWFAAGFPLLVLAILHARQSPDDRLPGSLLDTWTHVLGVVSLGAMLGLAIDGLVAGAHPVALALRMWLFTLVYLGTARAMLLSVRRHAARIGGFATPTLIVGAGVVGEHLVKRLLADSNYGLLPVGFLDASPLQPVTAHPHIPLLGGPNDLCEAIAQTGAGHVILAFSNEPDHALVDSIRLCQDRGVNVSLVPRLYESINERAELTRVGGMPLLALRPVDPRGWQFAIKHALDRSVALLALLALSPVLLAIAVAIRLSSPGPVLFRQRRVGRDGREFDLLKFRTMRESPQVGGFELPDGLAPGGVEGIDRRTRIGRLLRSSSLDELPQFLNVLRGEMSLVGPRPERPEFVQLFSSEVDRYDDRHRVKSGITGWAQVTGLRGQTSIADRVEWDNYYIQNWSLRLDLRILALTVVEMLRFRDGSARFDEAGAPSTRQSASGPQPG